jgi:hypothetical protein
MSKKTKIPNATASEYTAIYSEIEQENKDTERNRKLIYSNIQQYTARLSKKTKIPDATEVK